jgi:glycine cleavage system H protein
MLIDPQARYTRTHEWAKPDGALFAVGLSAYAILQLGKLSAAELPSVGTVLVCGQAFAVVESVKAAVEVHTPLGGTVTAVNTAVANNPDLLKRDVYESGWLVRIEPSDAAAFMTMMDADAYRVFLESGG